MDPDKLSAGQFHYRFHQGEQYNAQKGEMEEHISVSAHHPETGEGVALFTATRNPDVPKGMGKSKDRFEPGIAYTRPEYRRQGIGSTMANVARYEQPGLSQPLEPTRDLSPMGLEFSKKFFGKDAALPSQPTTGAWQNTEEVDEAIRTGTAPAMQLASGEGSRQSELARGLVPKLPKSDEPAPKYRQGKMFTPGRTTESGQRKEVPIKSAQHRK